MTLTSTPSKEIKNGNDVTTVFSFDFVINSSEDLQVTLTDSDGVETVLTEGTGTTNYSVSVTNYPGNGSITYPATLGTELATGETLTLARVVEIDQETDLQNQGNYSPVEVENTFNYSRMIDIQQQEQLDRSIKAPISAASGVNYELPAPSANRVIGIWNDDADAIEIGPTANAISNAQANATQTAADVVVTTANVTYAQEWAVNPEDTPVSVAAGGDGSTDFSALHWAAKAAVSAGTLPQNNFVATTAPTVNNDNTEGYSVGSRWVDTVGDESYILVDATTGAAVWLNSTLTLDELGALAVLDSVGTAQIDNNAVTLDKLEHGTQGDILYYGASGEPLRLSAGTAGQVLNTNGGGANPSWEDAGGGGISTVIDFADANDDATISFSNVFTAGKNYIIKFAKVDHGHTSGSNLQVEIEQGGSFTTSGYRYAIRQTLSDGSSSIVNSNSASIIVLGSDCDNGNVINGEIRINNPNDATEVMISGEFTYRNSSGTLVNATVSGTNSSATAVTGLRFSFGSDNIFSGRISIIEQDSE